MKLKAQTIIALVIIIFVGLFLNYKELNKLPKYIHTWTQIDRYALALKFTQSNLNFFKPETFVYNHIYPGNMDIPGDTTITSVDFPIHDYIPAVLMKATGSKSPIFFRLYILLYSLVGMFFLYKLSLLWTNNFFKSLFVTILAITSPVFIYYQGGFLPTIPSLANAIIGIYFYSLYIANDRNSSFNLAILFLTLAGLSRTTFLIPLIAILSVEFIRVLRKDAEFKAKIAPVLISFVLIVGYLLYNRYLRLEYGSMFLANFLPAKDMEEASSILLKAKDNWLTHYFTWFHYAIFGCIILLLVNFSICGRIGKWNKRTAIFGFFTLISFIGTFMFAGLLLKQFEVHDYYFLDSFYLPLLLLTLLILSFFNLPDTKKSRIVLSIVLASIGILLFLTASAMVKERRLTGAWDLHTSTVNNYENSEELLDALNVPVDAKIMVIDGSSPNAALALMNRNGYTLKYLTKNKVEKGLTWDFDYIVFENANFMKIVYPVYPEIVKKLKIIGGDGKITVCRLSDTIMDQTVEDIISLKDITPLWSDRITFDSVHSANWGNINITKDKAYSGRKSSKLTPDQLYGLSFDSSDLHEITVAERTLIVTGQFMRINEIEKCFVVVSLSINGTPNVLYTIKDLKDYITEKDVWQNIAVRFELPMVTRSDYKFSVYIWNVGKNDLFTDDFELKLY